MRSSLLLRIAICCAITSLPVLLPTASAGNAAARDAATNNATASQSSMARGRYLLRIAGCNDCHTAGYRIKAGNIDESHWLTGDRLGWQGPWGTTYASNLRLVMQRLTLSEWLQTARQPRRPPMPWFALRDMTDEDLASIYHYVRALGPAGTAAPPYIPPGQVAQTPVVKIPAY